MTCSSRRRCRLWGSQDSSALSCSSAFLAATGSGQCRTSASRHHGRRSSSARVRAPCACGRLVRGSRRNLWVAAVGFLVRAVTLHVMVRLRLSCRITAVNRETDRLSSLRFAADLRSNDRSPRPWTCAAFRASRHDGPNPIVRRTMRNLGSPESHINCSDPGAIS